MAEEEAVVTTGGGQKREEWSSRWAFYFAGVGAAVGFGKFDKKTATRSLQQN
jgi:SNF family Na+-dependent transporter